MTNVSPSRRPWTVWLALGAILVVHVVVALWAASGKSVTADEILHVTGGFYIDRYGDYRIQPENGVLPQRVHGLAAILTHAPTPPLEGNAYWRSSSNLVNSHQFFYETGHDHFPMLMIARGLNLVFSLGTALLVFVWGRRLVGATGGLVAAALYAADPNVLAHAALATSDLAAVFFLLAGVTAFGVQLERPSFARVALSGAVFGLACVAKHSAVLLLPVFALQLGWKLLADPAARRPLLRWLPWSALLHATGAVAIIWLFYGCRYSGFSAALPPASQYSATWKEVLPYIGFQGAVVDWFRRLHFLPEAFLYGYAWVIQSARARAAFLAGEYGYFGWVKFFPLAFLWKSTPLLLAGLVAVGVSAARRWLTTRGRLAADLLSVAPLVVLGVVYAVFSLTAKLNIGHRHILPLYPLAYVALGAWCGSPAWRPLARRFAAVVVVGAQATSTVLIAPDFMAYFNRLAGGPEHGYRLLVDSSLDWGQDLPALRDWLHEQASGPDAPPVFLSYFGSGEPSYYNIAATRLPFINGFRLPQQWYEPTPGIYCISATMLQQVYSGFGGQWTDANEAEYRRLRLAVPAFRAYYNDAAARAELLQQADAGTWKKNWERFDQLRFARLCTTLRQREPDAEAGHSILIYRVDAREFSAALD